MAKLNVDSATIEDTTRISILCDNQTTKESLGKEWGLSMALDMPYGDLWLWDCGASSLFLQNAKEMNVDINKAKGIALSHGHWDHTAGMDALMGTDFMGPVYAHPNFAAKRYALWEDDKVKEASFPCEYPGTIIVRDHTELDKGLFMITEIPRIAGLFEATNGLFIDPEMTTTDHVPDDSFLLMMTKSGPVVILGCCHSGLANSLYHLRDLTGLKSVHAIIGGLHLFEADVNEFESTAKVIEEFNPEMIATGHCTGDKGYEFLKDRLSCAVKPMGSGAVFEF